LFLSANNRIHHWDLIGSLTRDILAAMPLHHLITMVNEAIEIPFATASEMFSEDDRLF
jgi:hypothetical protein